MSDSKPHEDDEGVEVEDLEAAMSGGDDGAEADDARDPFDGLDEAVVARLGLSPGARPRRPVSADDQLDELGELDNAGELGEPGEGPAPRGRGRSPLVSLFVLAFAAYLLVAMFGDFRYWLRAEEPEDLGLASELVASGRLSADLHDHYVALEGTPDVKNAAVGATKSNLVGYLRITEGEGRLFAAIPRDKDQKVTNNFEGRYVGRMRKLSEDRAYPWLKQFFDTEKVAVPVDLDVASLEAALSSQAADGTIEVETERGKATLDGDQQIRLVVRQPDARVQLGKESFSGPEAADEAVAGLGAPWVRLEATRTFYRYAVRVPPGEHAAVQAKLVSGLPPDERDPGADPRVGALVLPRTATYLTAVGDLVRSEGDFVMPYAGNTTSPGYEVADGEPAKLVETVLRDGMLRIPAGSLEAARIERRVSVDPDGFMIAVGEPPSSERLTGVLWLVVLGIALANLVSLWVWWRRRAA